MAFPSRKFYKATRVPLPEDLANPEGAAEDVTVTPTGGRIVPINDCKLKSWATQISELEIVTVIPTRESNII